MSSAIVVAADAPGAPLLRALPPGPPATARPEGA
jgi:hypothetical protein